MATPAVDVRALTWRYPGDGRIALDALTLAVPAGARCLLVGRNGAGKSTLLRLLAGKHMVDADAVRVLGRPAFHDTSLSSRVTYLGSVFPFDVDVRVAEILSHRSSDPARRAELMRILEVDPEWHMHRVSDGQRRRVQILLALLAPAELLLLDEVTTDLDLIARADLLTFLASESTTRRTTIVYATHIMDALDGWITHVAMLDQGRLIHMSEVGDIAALAELRAAGTPSPLLRLIERWLRHPSAVPG
ncbi:MAG: ATP-binding cassette domain-containing protein [Deltaproteobacteria bacterium]|nr:ATP-binding cassette domain-containing protein [Deltaproteobacteria bacterium]